MLVLGVTADDKGEQLEQLVRTILTSQGYEDVRSNVVRAGGNELDIVAVRRAELMGEVHEVPLMGEAKAYADPVTTPTWQKFLGKLFIERAGGKSTIGVLIALNGVNGPVAGSADNLKKDDASLFVLEGVDLVKHAISAKQIVDEAAALQAAAGQFGHSPNRTDIAYYNGAYFWLLHWNDEKYSIVSGNGSMLLAEEVEKLRPACEASISGTLLATNEVLAEAQAKHLARLAVINMLFAGDKVALDGRSAHAQAIESLLDEPFTYVVDDELRLVPAEDLDTSFLFDISRHGRCESQ